METFNRARVRQKVSAELRKVRSYRQALRKCADVPADRQAYMRTWVRVADDMLASLRAEVGGEDKASFIDALYGINRRPIGSGHYVFSVSVHKYHMSASGLERWRENAIFTASVLAIKYGAIDLSNER